MAQGSLVDLDVLCKSGIGSPYNTLQGIVQDSPRRMQQELARPDEQSHLHTPLGLEIQHWQCWISRPKGVAKHNHTQGCALPLHLHPKYLLRFHVMSCISDDRRHGLVMAFVAKALSELMFCRSGSCEAFPFEVDLCTTICPKTRLGGDPPVNPWLAIAFFHTKRAFVTLFNLVRASLLK